jgi:hypothetical protein
MSASATASFRALPDGKLMLTNGGAPFGKHVKTHLNIGEEVVSPYLLSRCTRLLDAAALSVAH